MNTSASQVEWNHYWQQLSEPGDVGGSEFYRAHDQNFRQFGYVVGSRYCLLAKVYNEVGYPGTRPWSPRSQYSCIGAAQSQSAGFLLGTSDRNSQSNNYLYLRVKNFSGGTRNVGIFGPNLENIGCAYANLANNATRQCYITLARNAYTHLVWFAWQASNYSYGYLDFE